MKRREFITLVGGVAASCPLTARAQQTALPVIGYLSGITLEQARHDLAASKRGLSQAGYVEGQNLTIEYR